MGMTQAKTDDKVRCIYATTGCTSESLVVLSSRVTADCQPTFVHKIRKMNLDDLEIEAVCTKTTDNAPDENCNLCLGGVNVVAGATSECKVETDSPCCTPYTDENS